MNADPQRATPSSGDESKGNGSFDSSSSEPRSARERRRSRIRTGPTFTEALGSGWKHALELGDYVRSMIGVRTDRAQLAFRRKATQAGITAVAALGLGTLVIAASVRLVHGLADGLALLFGGRAWLGEIATAVLVLGGLAGGTALYLSRWEKKELEKHIEKYERHHREHRERHGQHVGDPAPKNPGGAPRP